MPLLLDAISLTPPAANAAFIPKISIMFYGIAPSTLIKEKTIFSLKTIGFNPPFLTPNIFKNLPWKS